MVFYSLEKTVIQVDVNFLAVVICVLLLDLSHFAPHTVMAAGNSASGGTKPFCARHMVVGSVVLRELQQTCGPKGVCKSHGVTAGLGEATLPDYIVTPYWLKS
jgi:hypothetical protein